MRTGLDGVESSSGLLVLAWAELLEGADARAMLRRAASRRLRMRPYVARCRRGWRSPAIAMVSRRRPSERWPRRGRRSHVSQVWHRPRCSTWSRLTSQGSRRRSYALLGLDSPRACYSLVIARPRVNRDARGTVRVGAAPEVGESKVTRLPRLAGPSSASVLFTTHKRSLASNSSPQEP